LADFKKKYFKIKEVKIPKMSKDNDIKPPTYEKALLTEKLYTMIKSILSIN
jgi:hypothetical protein